MGILVHSTQSVGLIAIVIALDGRVRQNPGMSGAMELEGKVALVTGASAGIGAAIARACTRRGRLSACSRAARRRPRPRARRSASPATSATARAVVAAAAERRRAPRRARHRRRQRRRRGLRTVPRARPGAPRGDDRRQPQGHALHRGRDAPAPDRVRRRRLRLDRQRRRAARVPRRVGLQRLEVRPARVHPLARPRAARERRAGDLRLPRAGSPPTSRSAPAARRATRSWRR